MMTIQLALPVGLTLLAGSVLQGAVGFAYVLFALPLLVWLGLELSQAVALVLVSMFVQVALGTFQLRRAVRWGKVVKASAIRFAILPLGVLTLVVIEDLPAVQIRQLLGGVLFAGLLVQAFVRVEPQEQLNPIWDWIAFICSGFLHGLAAIGGPPVVMWLMAHRWTNREIRGFLFALFLISAPVQLSLLFLTFGPALLGAMLAGLAFSPLVALGSLLGVKLGNRLSLPALRKIAYVLLFLIALTSLAAPWLQ